MGDSHDGTRETCRCRDCKDWREGKAVIVHTDGSREWAPGKDPELRDTLRGAPREGR